MFFENVLLHTFACGAASKIFVFLVCSGSFCFIRYQINIAKKSRKASYQALRAISYFKRMFFTKEILHRVENIFLLF